jgi:hypothetical protein
MTMFLTDGASMAAYLIVIDQSTSDTWRVGVQFLPDAAPGRPGRALVGQHWSGAMSRYPCSSLPTLQR